MFDIKGNRFAFSTDSYTVDPIFFPGGNIGDLSINGTVNDISMCGANPLYLSLSLVIEEGFLMSNLKKILKTMGKAAKKANVKIVTGDTKVVPKGAADKIFINTSGIGLISEDINISNSNAKVGDKIILSGNIADHGITILTQRKSMSFDTILKSDTAPLNKMTSDILEAYPDAIHVLHDPTRGGIGTALNEIAAKSEVKIRIYENKIPLKKETDSICALLGLDPLYIANEGKLLAFVDPDYDHTLLSIIKKNEFGKHSEIIGEVTSN